MNSFKTELYRVSFNGKTVALTKLSNETCQSFNALTPLASFIECNAHQFSAKDAGKVLGKAALCIMGR